MMKLTINKMNLNLVQICGRITKKPEITVSQSGVKVLSFSVATNRSWKDKDGKKQEETEFHNATAFGRTAEVICQYFDKGDEIYIQGRLKTSTWDDKDGTKRYKTGIMVERIDFGQKSRQNAPQRATEELETIQLEEIDVNQIPF